VTTDTATARTGSVDRPRVAAWPERFPPVPASPASPTSSADVDAVVTEILEVLLELDERGEPIGGEHLAARIPVASRDIDAAIRRLLDAGTARVVGDALALTETGREVAFSAVRRHRLTERLLADVIGLEWWKVHHEAERWEGVLSDDVEERLLDLLGDPGTCPHGNPIPGSVNRPSQADAVVLSEAPVGPVHIVRITETLEGDDEALQLLQNCGFVPGRDAELQRHADGWVLVAGSVHDAALPPHVAAHTYVAPR
jgi:DtxR family transcriptional regulator, Mn-dependent transcriptional regulator